MRSSDDKGERTVDISDLALYLKKNWDIDIEGYSIGTINSDLT